MVVVALLSVYLVESVYLVSVNLVVNCIFILTKEPHQGADTSKHSDAYLIEDSLGMGDQGVEAK